MKLLRGRLVEENKLLVEQIFNMEVEENKDVDTTIGVLVDEEPEFPPYTFGKGHLWFVNPETKEQWFEEYDRPLTPEELIQQQADTQAQILRALVTNDLI